MIFDQQVQAHAQALEQLRQAQEVAQLQGPPPIPPGMMAGGAPGMMPPGPPGMPQGMPPMPPGMMPPGMSPPGLDASMAPPPMPMADPMTPDDAVPIGKMRRPSAKKAEEIIQAFYRHFAAARSMKTGVEDIAIKAYRQFCCIIQQTGKVAYLLKIHDPHFFATVTSNVAAEVAITLGQPRLIQYRPRGTTSDVLASYFTAAVDYHVKENDRTRLEIIDTFFQKHIFGNAFGVTYWWEDWRKVGAWQNQAIPRLVPDVGLDGQVFLRQEQDQIRNYVTTRKKVKDSPRYDTLNFFNCYPDAEARSVREGRWFIYYERRPLSYIKEMAKTGAWFKSACREIIDNPHAFLGSETDDTARMLSNRSGFSTDPGVDADDPLIDVHEYMTPEGRATIVGQKLVVAYREGYVTGYYPIIHVRNHHAPGEFWGMSDLVPVETQLVALQNMYAAQVTETVMQVFRPIIVTDPSVNLDRFEYKPGAIWKAPGAVPGSIQPLRGDASGIQHGSNLCNDLRSRIDTALGSGDTQRGALPSHPTSATAVNTSEANANIRQGPSSIENEDSLIGQIGEQFAKLIMSCQTQAITTRINGGSEVIQIMPEILNQDLELEVEIVSGAQQANELEQKRLLELGNLAMNFQVATFNREEFIKVMAEAAVPRIAERIIMNPQAAAQQAALQQQISMINPGADGPGPGPGGGVNASPTNNGGISVGPGKQDMGGTTELSREHGGQQRVD